MDVHACDMYLVTVAFCNGDRRTVRRPTGTPPTGRRRSKREREREGGRSFVVYPSSFNRGVRVKCFCSQMVRPSSSSLPTHCLRSGRRCLFQFALLLSVCLSEPYERKGHMTNDH